MNIITGYTGTPHITSAQDRAAHQGIIGEGSYILNVGNRLAAEVISANEIRIRDGVLSHQGCFGIVESGTYDTLAIANGSQGMLRHDLIVCRYAKNTGTNVESLSLVVLQGAASASSPADPAYNTGNIQNGDSPVDFPLYRVNIDGITIDSVDNLADDTGSLASLPEMESNISTALHRSRQALEKGVHTNVTCRGATGYVTGSSVHVIFFVPLLLASDVTAINVTKLLLHLRHWDGYIGSDGYDATSEIAVVDVLSDQPGLLVQVSRSSGWGVTNNISISGDVEMTFTLS